METNHDTNQPTTKRHTAAEAMMDTIRKRLVDATTSQDRATSLHDLVQSIAQQEAIIALEWQVVMCIQYDVEDRTEDECRREVAEYARETLLDSGADDTWSGRANDLRRSVFDAQRRWVKDALR